ncbi:PspA/IM30 family protein [Ralstonia solanacearum species complex bacterium KE056]|uniref:PspA/IM30 family protein n=1 Tax=Ralstonia solanacearum species complex bacterium KE056 TaxID=3119585 RepID=UPI002FC29ED7
MTIDRLGNRVKRLLSANVHALVSSLESRVPQAVAEQYLREFDEVIGQARNELGKHEAARYQAGKAITRINNEIERLTELVATALARGDEAAARSGTERQIDLEDQFGILYQTLQESNERAQAAESDLLGLRAKRNEMEAALNEMIAARAAARQTASEDNPSHPGANARAEQLEQGFNRTMAHATGSTGLGTGHSGADPLLLKRLEALHKTERINERLARLRSVRLDPADTAPASPLDQQNA